MMLYIIVIYVVIYKYIYAVYIIPTYPNRKIHKNHWIPSPGDAWSPQFSEDDDGFLGGT